MLPQTQATPWPEASDPAVGFTDLERRDLDLLRTRYALGGDEFSARDLAHLRLARRLFRTGRLESQA